MTTNVDIPSLIDRLPFAVQWLNAERQRLHMNDAFDVLLALDATLGDQLVHYLDDTSEPLHVLVGEQRLETWVWNLGSDGVLIGLMPAIKPDLSERDTAKEHKRLLLALQNIISTTKGYAELIAVMLEENLIVAGERLEAIRRYEQYVSDHLQDMEALVESALDRKPMAQLLEQGNPQLALVHFALPVQGEVIAELFRAQGMVVTQAASMEAAKQILREQGAAIDLLVIDRWFEEVSPWLDRDEDRQLILFGSQSFEHPRARCLKGPKLDINHVLRSVIELNERSVS